MPVPDSVVRAVKKDFGVELTQAEIAATETKRDLYYVLERRAVAGEQEKPCRSMRIFHRLRRALVDCFGVDRRAVNPDTPISALLPSGRQSAAYRELAAASALKLPGVKPPISSRMLVGLVIAVPFFLSGLLLLIILMAAAQLGDGTLLIIALIPLVLAIAAVCAFWRTQTVAARVRRLKGKDELTIRRMIRSIVERPEDTAKAMWARVRRYRLPQGSSIRRDQWYTLTSREALREALAAYMREDIWSFEFDDAIRRIDSKEGCLWELSIALWTLYDDMSDHPIGVTPAVWELLRRILAALASDLPLEMKHQPSPDLDNPPPELDYEPFWTAGQWQRYEGLLDQYNLPEYDVAVHAWRFGLSRDMLASPYHGWDEREWEAFMVALPAVTELAGSTPAAPPAPPSP